MSRRRRFGLVAGALTATVMALTPAVFAQKAAPSASAVASAASSAAPSAAASAAPVAAAAAAAAAAVAAPAEHPAGAVAAPPNGQPAVGARSADLVDPQAGATGPSGTPLNLRPAPGALAPLGAGSNSLTLQLGVLGALLLGGYFLWKRRGVAVAAAPTPPKILARTAVGVRSELLVVDVDGTKMLLGITPGSIQRLAVLSAPEMAAHAEMGEPAIEAEPGFRGVYQREAPQVDVHEEPAFHQAARAVHAQQAGYGAHGGHASHPAHAPAPARIPGPAATMNAARSPSVLAAFSPPGKGRGGRPMHAEDVGGRSTIPGLGDGDIEEQARGLREARSRA